MYAGRSRKSIMFTSAGAHLGCAVEEDQLTLEGGFVHASAAGAGAGIRDDFQDVR